MTDRLHIGGAGAHHGLSTRAVLVGAIALLGWAAAPIARSQLPLPNAGAGVAPVPPALAPPGESAPGTAASVSALEAKLAEARANLAAGAALDPSSLTNALAGIPPQDLSLRRGLLQRFVRVCERHLTLVTELEAARNRKLEVAREAQAWTGFTEPRPYSILLADDLRAEIAAERLTIHNSEAGLSVLDEFTTDHRQTLARSEEAIRQVNEQLEGTKDPVVTGRLAWQRELERLRRQVAAESIAALDLDRQARQERLAESRLRLGLKQRQLIIAEAAIQFTQVDLDKVLARVEAERQQLERELAEAETRQSAAHRALDVAREDLRRIQAQPDGGAAATTRAAELADVRRVQLETAETAVNVTRLLLEGGNTERTMWELRFAAYNSRNAETLRQSERRLETFIRRVDLWRDFYRQQVEVAASQTALQETRVNNLDPGSDLLPLARDRLAALREQDQLLRRSLRMIERVERLLHRWGEGIRDAEGKLPFTSRVRNAFSGGRSSLDKLWNLELFTAEDTITVDGQKITGRRGVTIGKIVMAVLILVVGYWLTGLISRIVEPFIVKRLKIEPNQANLIRRWLRACLVASLVLFSLTSVKIPLTVFAFAGGALAIGLGFGTQTLLKNFVSGIILLFERPFRVGDVLDVGGHRGTVNSIGLRASVLQLWDGTETLIPNSSLLESNVTNWTYSNRKVRFAITVGVAYGSDSRRVIQLLAEVAERHGLVEKEPKVQVLFTDFGESALTFELRFWVDVLRANAAQVASDLRQMIVGAFDENRIVIAFPQREIRLEATRPVPVHVVPPPPA